MYFDFVLASAAEERLHKINSQLAELQDVLYSIRSVTATMSDLPEMADLTARMDSIDDRMTEEREMFFMVTRQLLFVRERVDMAEKRCQQLVAGEIGYKAETIRVAENRIDAGSVIQISTERSGDL